MPVFFALVFNCTLVGVCTIAVGDAGHSQDSRTHYAFKDKRITLHANSVLFHCIFGKAISGRQGNIYFFLSFQFYENSEIELSDDLYQLEYKSFL